MGKRILLTTTGSLGDLHPIMAIGLGLQARGYRTTIATSNYYRRKVETAGLEFAPMGPHLDPGDPELARTVMTPLRGPIRLIRKILYPAVPAAYKEVMEALRGADLIVTHPITFGSQIAAEKTGMPWISTVTAPIAFGSEYDPPVMAPIAGWRPGPKFARLFNKLGRASTGRWTKPIAKFRKSLGLPRGQDPIFEGQHSPKCGLTAKLHHEDEAPSKNSRKPLHLAEVVIVLLTASNALPFSRINALPHCKFSHVTVQNASATLLDKVFHASGPVNRRSEMNTLEFADAPRSV